MLRRNDYKTHHYYLRDYHFKGEKYMDTKGIIWIIDDIADDYMVVESVLQDKITIKKIDPLDYNDFLHYRLC